MAIDHRAVAADLIKDAADMVADIRTVGSGVGDIIDIQSAMAVGGLATANALLYVGDQIRLANLLASSEPPRLDIALNATIDALIRHEIRRVVDPASAEALDAAEMAGLRIDLRQQTDLVDELRRQLGAALRRAERAESTPAASPEGARTA